MLHFMSLVVLAAVAAPHVYIRIYVSFMLHKFFGNNMPKRTVFFYCVDGVQKSFLWRVNSHDKMHFADFVLLIYTFVWEQLMGSALNLWWQLINHRRRFRLPERWEILMKS